MTLVVIQSELTQKQFLKINMSFYFARWFVWIIYLAAIADSYFLLTEKNIDWLSGDVIFQLYIIAMAVLLPLWVYYTSGRAYRNSKIMGEKREFIFTDDHFEYRGQTSSMTSALANILMIKERNLYFLVFPTKRTIHYLPKSGFASADDIEQFKKLIIQKGIKHHFKK